jgi:acyl-CoA synthetase (AMP-forming)/AMP-acid ligase II
VNLGALLPRIARRQPNAVAFRHGEAERTYRSLCDRALRLGGALRGLGMTPGDRVGIVMSNRPELLESMFAAWSAGLAVVPINARLHPSEMAYILNNAEARALICSDEFDEPLRSVGSALEAVTVRVSTGPDQDAARYEELIGATAPVERVVDVPPDSLAWLFYTSGTTGRPKGVIMTHRMMRIGVMNYLADIYSFQPEDVVLHVAPLTHGSGNVALASLARGATNVILQTSSFEPRAAWELIERWRVTAIAFIAPTQIVKLLADDSWSGFDLSSLRSVCYGGGPMYVEDLKLALERFGPIWVQVFGQGESPMTISYLRREDHLRWHKEDERRLGSAGVPRTDVEVRVVDEQDADVPRGLTGEIVVRGDIVMPGYWNDPEASADALRGGWLHTGDLGTFDELGYLYVLDRSKDMIVSGGHNLYPREIEEVILTHPAVAEVAVIGIPDDYWGESVHAVVVLRDGASVGGDEIQAHCRASLASYKKPRSVEFVSELPKSSYGKVLKRELREPYWRGYERRVGGGRRPSAEERPDP